MKLALFLLVAPALVPTGAAAQSLAQHGPRPSQHAKVVHAEELPGHGPAVRVGGDSEPLSLPAPLSDEVPPAGRAVVEVLPGGDRIVTPAGGDPFYLGFAAGVHRPPAGETIDPDLLASLRSAYDDARPAAVTYAFVMLAWRITDERLASLEALGVRVLGLHPSNCVRVALPVDSLDALADHPDVRWVGIARPWQKVHPVLSELVELSPPYEPLDLIVSVFESDLNADTVRVRIGAGFELDGPAVRPVAEERRPVRIESRGWQQRALEKLGIEVVEYIDSVHAFRVRAFPALLEPLAARDFVQFIEADLPRTFGHDDSMPMIYADSGRFYFNGSTSGVIVGGQIDSGLDTGHNDLGIWGVGWELGGTGGAWSDPCEHGTHVAGSFLGRGNAQARYRGAAPGLGFAGNRRFYNVKTSNACSGWNFNLQTAMNLLNTAYTDGGGATTPIPHVINHSWGTTGGTYLGSEASARIFDAEVLSGQMHVVIAHNAGPGASTVSLEGSAKNVLTVGSVNKGWTTGSTTPGEINNTSGRGPTGDDRWKPNVCAPGNSINSADAGTASGYSVKSGTSMAAPQVSGVAAQLMDRYSFLRYVPERINSLLMATALTRNGQLLTTPGDAHLDEYGAGRIEALRGAFGTAQIGWTNWGAWLPANNYTWADFTINPGATRLIVCMNYVESAASAGASQALVNDYDLYIDQPPIDPAFNTGEWIAQQSARDNTEIRILNNPTSGTWRWKIWPRSAPSGAYYGLTVAVVYADTTPDVAVSVAPAKTYLRPNEQTDVVVAVSSPAYIASAVAVETAYATGGGWAFSVVKTLGDGPTSSLGAGSNVRALFGDILHGNSRNGTWRTAWSSEGVRTFSATARGENIPTTTGSANVIVDGTPPGLVGNLGSSSHTVNVWSNGTSLTTTWTPATDNLSGLDGYSISLTTGGPGTPDTIQDIGTVTSSTQSLASSAAGRWFNIRAVDRSGNWGSTASIGPFLVDNVAPGAPSGLSSPTHQLNVISCNTNVTVSWNAGTDAHSGVAGYRYLWDHSPGTSAAGGINLGTGTSQAFNLLPSPQPWYLHLATRDFAGNLSGTVHLGPFRISPTPPAVYCLAKINSLGCEPSASFSGTPSLSSSSFTVHASNLLAGQPGMMFWSLQQSAIPFQGGWLCAAPPVVRTPITNSGGTLGTCNGTMSFTFTSAYMLANGLSVGQTVYNQFWTRDPGSPSGTGLTDAVRFTICQ